MKTANLLFIPALATLLFVADTSSAKVIDEHIRIIPVGQVDGKIAESLKTRLAGSFPMEARLEITARKELPQDAYDETRKQYDAQAIIDDIARQIGIDLSSERALILADADLYAANKDFVFGLADAKKGICIISTTRLGNERILKEAIYELGSSLGIEDCPLVKCVMHHSDNIQDIDKKSSAFCHKCRDDLLGIYTKPMFKNASVKPLI